jgi:AraC-like DNA-binding protein
MNAVTGLVRIPTRLLDVGVQHGLERAWLLQAVGLTEEALHDPDARISIGVIWELWRTIIDVVPDPHLGLKMGEDRDMGPLGVVGYSMKYSGTLRRAFDRLARYIHVCSQAVQLQVDERPDRFQVTFKRETSFELLRQPVDVRLAWLVTLARALTQSDLDPLEVQFPYARPDETHEHARVFRAPLRFGADISGVSLRVSDLDREIPTADETLDTHLDQYIEGLLKGLAEPDSLTESVVAVMWAQLSGGKSDLATTARQLGMSPRSVQRRLHEEGATYGKVLEAFRNEAAVKLLKGRQFSVEEIAFILGYSEPSTFYRAFRRWTGLTPRKFRSCA